MALVLAVAAGFAAASASASGSSAARLRLDARVEASLRAHELRLTAVSPARRSGQTIVLPVARAHLTARSSVVVLAGGLRLSTGRRSVVLRSLRLRAHGRSAGLSTRLAGRRIVLTVCSRPKRSQVDPAKATLSLSGCALRLTPAAALALSGKLGVGGLREAMLGSLSVTASSGSAKEGGGSAGGGSSSATGSGSAGSGGGPAGGGLAGPGKGGKEEEPPVEVVEPKREVQPLSRPASAVPLTGATLTWHVRNSLICYIATGQGTTAIAPASEGPKIVEPPKEGAGCSEPHVYEFSFPFKEGWIEPVSGEAEVSYQGGVSFRYSGHGIDLNAAEPIVQLNGPGSLASFLTSGTELTKEEPTRALMMDLQPEKVTPTESGTTVTYTQMPGVVPPEGEDDSVLAEFYLPGDEFGWVTMSLTYG